MAVGDVQGPLRSDFGFHIVRLDDILERGPLPLDQVRGELLSELRDREAESLFLDLERGLSDALFDMTDIGEIASAIGTEVGTIDGFTRDGAEPFGSNQAAIDTVFDPTSRRWRADLRGDRPRREQRQLFSGSGNTIQRLASRSTTFASRSTVSCAHNRHRDCWPSARVRFLPL